MVIKNSSWNVVWEMEASLSIGCDVGDTIIAFVTTRSSATFSAGWTILAQTPAFSSSNQILYCLQTVATDTTETIEVSQGGDPASKVVMIQLLSTRAKVENTAFVNKTGGLVNTSTTAIASKLNADDVVLWGVSINFYKSEAPRGKITISPNENTIMYSSGITDYQDRQVVFWDNNNALQKTFNFAPALSSGGGTGYGLLGVNLFIPPLYKLATDGTDTYGYTGSEWEVVIASEDEPDVQAFLDYGVLDIPNFDGLPAECHLLIYDPDQGNKQYTLNIESNPPDQVVTMKSGVALPFGTTAEEPTITVATDGGGTAVMTDWKQTGNKVKVEITMSKPDRNATASVSEIKVPFHKGS